jgi:hypothetical protein
MPIVGLPDDFEVEISHTNGQISDTDGSGVAAYVKDISTDRVDVYIGLGLDNYTKYKNISETNPNIKFAFYLNPSVHCSRDVYDYDPNSDSAVFEIKGSDLRRGSRKDDVTVRIGDGICELVELTDDHITCKPPAEKPNKETSSESSTSCGEDELPVQVLIGNADYSCNCFKYKSSSSSSKWKLIVGIVVGVGGAILLAVIIAVIVIIASRCKKRKSLPLVGYSSGKSSAENNNDFSNPMSLGSKSGDLDYEKVGS